MESEVELKKVGYRKPESFALPSIERWDEFLKRWDNPTIGIPEAKGLLHEYSLSWADDFIGCRPYGDDRETFVRFLLHYAGRSSPYDNVQEIIEKAREILLKKVVDTKYMREEATDNLVLAVLGYFINLPKSELPDREPGWRKFENFLKIAGERDKRDIRFLIPVLILRFADDKYAIRKLWKIRRS